jgi:threonine/homoserine/homoserine lactone efflux protein
MRYDPETDHYVACESADAFQAIGAELKALDPKPVIFYSSAAPALRRERAPAACWTVILTAMTKKSDTVVLNWSLLRIVIRRVSGVGIRPFRSSSGSPGCGRAA